jgi:hypothetical protein
MNMIEKVSVAVVWAFAATALFADIKLLEPAQDATVSQHTPMQARLVGETIAEREKYFDGGVNAKELKDAGSKPKEILLQSVLSGRSGRLRRIHAWRCNGRRWYGWSAWNS